MAQTSAVLAILESIKTIFFWLNKSLLKSQNRKHQPHGLTKILNCKKKNEKSFIFFTRVKINFLDKSIK